MNTALGLDRATAESAVSAANKAPSIHNSQPWIWELDSGELSLRADRSRWLPVIDPDGHALQISCGGALELLSIYLRSAGYRSEISVLPDADDDDLLARVQVGAPAEPRAVERHLLELAGNRRSDRRPFRRETLSAAVVDELIAATDGDGVHSFFPVSEDQTITLASAISWADRVERNDARYIDETTRWLDDPYQRGDGIALTAVAHLEPEQQRHSAVALRDFELGVRGHQLVGPNVDESSFLAVLITASDSPFEQLSTGRAMMRLMLAAQNLGLATCPLSQAVDWPQFRARVQTLMDWQGTPQMMLRVGHPVDTALLPATPRRAVSDVLRVTAHTK